MLTDRGITENLVYSYGYSENKIRIVKLKAPTISLRAEDTRTSPLKPPMFRLPGPVDYNMQ